MTKIFNRMSEKEKRRILRKTLSPAEIQLWQRFKDKQLGGYKFRRQYSVGPYVVDFYCPAVKLAVEVDGRSHDANDEMRSYDRQRQNYIESFGIRFLRIANWEVMRDLEGVLKNILIVCGKLDNTTPNPSF